MKKRKKEILNIFDELSEVCLLHKIEQDTIEYCIENDQSIAHLLVLNSLIQDRLQSILKKSKRFI